MRRALAFAAVIALLVLPSAALGHGDEPAVEALESGDLYLPHEPAVPEDVADALEQTVRRSRDAGYPLKVAVLATKHDLGEAEQLFGQPAFYARWLSRSVGRNRSIPLLIVTPSGYGTEAAGASAPAAIARVKPPSSGSADALGRSAIDATHALAKAAGHPFAKPEISGGTSPLLVVGVPVLLLVLAGGLVALRTRQSTATRA